ncbi:MAG: hypothetical protein IPN04_10560 [Rhodoferax sp.]|nr:hypothetical protein [Rhodoferax sp.]
MVLLYGWSVTGVRVAYKKMVIAQDTGSAIVGKVVRADYFAGWVKMLENTQTE